MPRVILGCLRLDCALNVITGMLERWKVCVYTYESPTQAWTPNTNTDTVNIQNIQYQDTPHNHWLWHEHCHTVNVQNIGYHDTTHTHNQHGKICSPKNKVKLYNFHMIMTLTNIILRGVILQCNFYKWNLKTRRWIISLKI